eukprot:2018056-Lingulodinium_polyedra.AAC.1
MMLRGEDYVATRVQAALRGPGLVDASGEDLAVGELSGQVGDGAGVRGQRSSGVLLILPPGGPRRRGIPREEPDRARRG